MSENDVIHGWVDGVEQIDDLYRSALDGEIEETRDVREEECDAIKRLGLDRPALLQIFSDWPVRVVQIFMDAFYKF